MYYKNADAMQMGLYAMKIYDICNIVLTNLSATDSDVFSRSGKQISEPVAKTSNINNI